VLGIRNKIESLPKNNIAIDRFTTRKYQVYKRVY